MKRRHCDPRPQPPGGSAYGGGTAQTGRGVWKCPPVKARVFARPRRFGVAVGRGLPRGAPQIGRFGQACGGGCHGNGSAVNTPHATQEPSNGPSLSLPAVLNINALALHQPPCMPFTLPFRYLRGKPPAHSRRGSPSPTDLAYFGGMVPPTPHAILKAPLPEARRPHAAVRCTPRWSK